MANTYADLDDMHRWFRGWYYEAGGIHLSENGRTRYGEVQELMAAQLEALGSKAIPSKSSMPIPDDAYGRLLDSCSALRTALTEDLESRRQRSILYSMRLAIRHWKQRRKAAGRLAKAKGSSSRSSSRPRGHSHHTLGLAYPYGQFVPGLLKLAALPDEDLRALVGSLLEGAELVSSE